MHHEMVSFANQLYFGVELMHLLFISAREKASRRCLRLVPGRAGNCIFDDCPSPEELPRLRPVPSLQGESREAAWKLIPACPRRGAGRHCLRLEP